MKTLKINVFYFFVKNLLVIWAVLAFWSETLWYLVSIFPRPCWIATLLSKFGSVFWHDPLCFQCHEISDRCEVVNGKFFCWTVVSASHSHSHWFFFLSCCLHLILISLPVLSLVISLLYFHLCWPVSSFNYSVLL